MAGKITTNSVVLGDSITDTQNFVLKTNADGTATLARGALGGLGTVFGVNGSGALTGATLVAPALGAATATSIAVSGASTFTGTGKFATTIGVGNATPSASGSGITFPATQSASTNANTLDDYEEGTWTPLITNIDNTQVVTLTSAGSYVKVGRLVSVNISSYGTDSSAISAGSHIYLRGLPFSALAINGTAQYIGSVMSQYPAQPVSLVDVYGTQAPMYAAAAAQDWSQFTRNTWGGATSISWRMSFCYEADA